MQHTMILSVLLLLTACGAPPPARDYEGSNACVGRGYIPGEQAFENCVREERAGRLLEQQRQEFERRKADEEQWKMRRF